MAQLFLWFVCDSEPELSRTRFEHPILADKREAIRGNTGGALPLGNTFKWTNAVRALSVLLLRSAGDPAAGEQLYTLSGCRGSLAASLDYAISKEPNWLLDMFGQDLNGSAVARRLFTRTNPERKRAGPVILALNHRMLRPDEINVMINGSPCDAASQCLDLAQRIEGQFIDGSVSEISERARFSLAAVPTHAIRSSPRRNHISTSDETESKRCLPACQLSNLFRREILEMLRSTDIFNPSRLRRTIAILRENTAFEKIVPLTQDLISSIDQNLKYGQRLGMSPELSKLGERFPQVHELSVAVPPALIGSIAIFRFLQLRHQWPKEIRCDFAHSLEIISHVQDGRIEPPDLLILGLAQGGRFFSIASKYDYVPLMVMPRISQRIVAPKVMRQSSKPDKRSRYLFMSEEPSDAAIYFSQLQSIGAVQSRSVRIQNVEPFEAASMLSEASADIQAILWFPHYELNALFNGCRIVDPTKYISGDRTASNLSEFANTVSFAFMHRRLLAQRTLAEFINIAIRDAWMTLKEGGDDLDRVVEHIVNDDRYVGFIRRCSGLEFGSKFELARALPY